MRNTSQYTKMTSTPLSTIFTLLLLILPIVLANTEKTIFTAPALTTIPLTSPSLSSLLLTPLSPSSHPTLRTYINASFPHPSSPLGTSSWFLLTDLNPSQRYELRLCWLASQPTNFHLETYTLDQVFSTPDLLTNLTTYAYARESLLTTSDLSKLQSRYPLSLWPQNPSSSSAPEKEIQTSILFLQIQSQADYFTHNKTLMQSVPAVHIDLILDPYILNVFPRSLVPTAGYLIVIAIFAWILSECVWGFFGQYAGMAKEMEGKGKGEGKGEKMGVVRKKRE